MITELSVLVRLVGPATANSKIAIQQPADLSALELAQDTSDKLPHDILEWDAAELGEGWI